LSRPLATRKWLRAAVGAYEAALFVSNAVDGRLKALGRLKTASLVGCPFWLDLGSAVGRELGVSEEPLRDLAAYRERPACSEVERLVLDLAVADTPVEVPAEPRRRRQHFGEGQPVGLAATLARENDRACFNRALGARPVGYCAGAFCVLPGARRHRPASMPAPEAIREAGRFPRV
jgi:alkylhydroperoxidase family enzyme